MRFANVGMIGVVAVIAAGLTAWAQPGQTPAQQPAAAFQPLPAGDLQTQVDDASGMIALTAPVNDNRQMITVIDPRGQVMSVYHVELGTGTIELKSVRKIQWDLQMVQFNGTSPLPQEIRAKIEQIR